MDSELSEKKNMFMYVIILIVSIYIFSFINIKLNTILAICIACIIIKYLYTENKESNDNLDKQHNIKVKNIQPKPQKLDKYRDVIDFLFSIQDMYYYNQQAYEDLIDNLDIFFQIYENMHIGEKLYEHNYELAVNKKHNSINSLHSLIYEIPISMNDKLSESLVVLEDILNRYLDELREICEDNIIKNGYDKDRHIIHTGPLQYNRYLNSEIHSYDYY